MLLVTLGQTHSSDWAVHQAKHQLAANKLAHLTSSCRYKLEMNANLSQPLANSGRENKAVALSQLSKAC